MGWEFRDERRYDGLVMHARVPTPNSGSEPRRPEKAADPRASNLATMVYSQLRSIAREQMRGERVGHTLTATALVHEAYLKLSPGGMPPSDRSTFYHAAAGAMRRILIDHARRRGASKRGRGLVSAVEIESVLDLARRENLEDVLALDEAILRLDKADPKAASVVRLRFFAGLSGDETAEVLGMSPRQADREWAYARAFLLQELRGTERGRDS